MIVPEEFVAERVTTSGAAGQDWIDKLPDVVEDLAAKWHVELTDDAPRHGAAALVVFGTRRDEPCALKVCWRDHDAASEAAALRAWDGGGAARLFGYSDEHNALLLEKLDPARSLQDLDLPAAAAVVGGLIRQLAIPAPEGMKPSLTAAGAARAIPAQNAALRAVPDGWARLATGLAEGIAAADGHMLIHTDLHSDNVLAAERQPWLAVDPRPSIGHPERSVPDLLLWRLPLSGPAAEVADLLDTMIAAGDLDAERAYAWMVISAVGHWLWCQGEDADLPPGAPRCTICAPRCSRVLEALT